MADTCAEYVISTVRINDATAGADRLITDFEEGEILGLDGAPVRSQIDPRGQTDGGIVFPKFFGARIISFKGRIHIQSVEMEDKTAYVTAVNVLEAAVVSALEAILNTPTPLTWTPTGGSGKSITVTYGVTGQEIQFTGNMLDRKFSFSLVAEDPTIT